MLIDADFDTGQSSNVPNATLISYPKPQFSESHRNIAGFTAFYTVTGKACLPERIQRLQLPNASNPVPFQRPVKYLARFPNFIH